MASATLAFGTLDCGMCVVFAGACGPFVARSLGSCVPASVSCSVRALPVVGTFGRCTKPTSHSTEIGSSIMLLAVTWVNPLCPVVSGVGREIPTNPLQGFPASSQVHASQ